MITETNELERHPIMITSNRQPAYASFGKVDTEVTPCSSVKEAITAGRFLARLKLQGSQMDTAPNYGEFEEAFWKGYNQFFEIHGNQIIITPVKKSKKKK
jgi:hypothetical protein